MFFIYYSLIIIGVCLFPYAIITIWNKPKLMKARVTALILAIINILFYVIYASIYAGSLPHDPRQTCGNQALIYLVILFFWIPCLVSLIVWGVYWIIKELKDSDNKHAIIKILIPSAVTILLVLLITQKTFWNPNAPMNRPLQECYPEYYNEDSVWMEDETAGRDSIVTREEVEIEENLKEEAAKEDSISAK